MRTRQRPSPLWSTSPAWPYRMPRLPGGCGRAPPWRWRTAAPPASNCLSSGILVAQPAFRFRPERPSLLRCHRHHQRCGRHRSCRSSCPGPTGWGPVPTAARRTCSWCRRIRRWRRRVEVTRRACRRSARRGIRRRRRRIGRRRIIGPRHTHSLAGGHRHPDAQRHRQRAHPTDILRIPHDHDPLLTPLTVSVPESWLSCEESGVSYAPI